MVFGAVSLAVEDEAFDLDRGVDAEGVGEFIEGDFGEGGVEYGGVV